MCYLYELSGWWMLFGWLLFAIFWGGIIALVIWIARRIMGTGDSEGSRLCLVIAKQRYARGEISREEFEQIKKDLS